MSASSDDARWMRRALEEGQKGLGATCPNPAVGAVIVRDGVELACGYHAKAGEPHAERMAIADARARGVELAGATIYVTLEPCSTKGKTPPCVDGIIEAGIARVCYACVDVNPEHAGGADPLLRAAGIDVERGVLAEECAELILGFSKRMQAGIPWVLAKTAMSWDGRITRPAGEGQWLTGKPARRHVHELRDTVDAIIVGGETVRQDNPQLTVRLDSRSAEKKQPLRVVMTRGEAELPASSHLFTDEHRVRTIVLEDVSPVQCVQQLADLGCNRVLLECGGGLMREFVAAGLVDELYFYYAPILTGGEVMGMAGGHLPASVQLESVSLQQYGDDILLHAKVKKGE